MLLAVNYIHCCGIVHRDIKPRNWAARLDRLRADAVGTHWYRGIWCLRVLLVLVCGSFRWFGRFWEFWCFFNLEKSWGTSPFGFVFVLFLWEGWFLFVFYFVAFRIFFCFFKTRVFPVMLGIVWLLSAGPLSHFFGFKCGCLLWGDQRPVWTSACLCTHCSAHPFSWFVMICGTCRLQTQR